VKPERNTQFFLAWTIWTSFLAGPVVLLLLARFQQERLEGVLPTDIPIVWLRTLSYLFTIILFPIIGGIKRRMERKNAAEAVAAGSLAEKPFPIARNLTGLIVALALAETIAILGLFLFLIGDSLQTLTIFIGLSALAMLLHRPAAQLSP
jgi:uncharacterized membrane protein